jgi:hypothetical protein
MRLTIPYALLDILFLIAVGASHASAQSVDDAQDAFARHRWHAEFSLQAATEAWNYNVSHEELLGLQQGLTYGLRDGLQLTLTERVIYVSQRAQDTWVLGLSGGVRKRVYRRGRVSAFAGVEIGISDTSIATPPRGTRFNYVLIANGGILVRLRPRLGLITSLQWTHLSNASLKGPGRNPDIEAIGPAIGLRLGF